MSARAPELPAWLVDTDAEDALVGAALVWPERVQTVAGDVTSAHFHHPRNAALWSVGVELAAEGVRPDPLLVADRARSYGIEVDALDLTARMANALPPDRAHVDVVLRRRAARAVWDLGGIEAKGAIAEGADPYATAAKLARDLDLLASASARQEPEALAVPDLVASAESTDPWVIDGLLRADSDLR